MPNAFSGFFGSPHEILVFPDGDYQPTFALQTDQSFGIPFNISFDLRYPISCICFWDYIMLGAAMPETAVDEDGNFRLGKNNVGSSVPIFNRPNVNSISQT